MSQTLAPSPTPKAFGASRGKSEVTVCRRLVGQVYNEKDPNSGGGGKRKAKKSDSKVASQLGLLVTFADRGCLNGGPGNMSIADWEVPQTGSVLLNTFDPGMRAWSRVFLPPSTVPRSPVSVRATADTCYDQLNREGIPKVPRDKRLPADLAALRRNVGGELSDRMHPWRASESRCF